MGCCFSCPPWTGTATFVTFVVQNQQSNLIPILGSLYFPLGDGEGENQEFLLRRNTFLLHTPHAYMHAYIRGSHAHKTDGRSGTKKSAALLRREKNGNNQLDLHQLDLDKMYMYLILHVSTSTISCASELGITMLQLC